MLYLQTKFSHLDMIGRPVVALEKTNAVPEHNQYFQVYKSIYNTIERTVREKHHIQAKQSQAHLDLS